MLDGHGKTYEDYEDIFEWVFVVDPACHEPFTGTERNLIESCRTYFPG